MKSLNMSCLNLTKRIKQMRKTILLTGATDGIGLETAKRLTKLGHTLLLHGRNETKLAQAKQSLITLNQQAQIETYIADLSNLAEVANLAELIKQQHNNIDVLINNAGIYTTPTPITSSGHDVRFVVNTLAPYVLTERLLPLLNNTGRVINLSSAAQASVNLDALTGEQKLTDSAAYAQSKLAITMWTFYLAQQQESRFPTFIAVNPASFLGSKMVKQAYGMAGKDISIGAEVLERAALSETFKGITGKYFDNDVSDWVRPHPDALNQEKNQALINVLQQITQQVI